MGLFTSICPHCAEEIYWFLTAPENYVCKDCNKPVSARAIEDSFYSQVHSNPITVAYLESLTLKELEQMKAETAKGKPVKSPREDDDFWVTRGHFYLLDRALEETRREVFSEEDGSN